MVDKDYEQDFKKEIGEHDTPVVVVTEPHEKRSNIDDIEEAGKKQFTEITPEELVKVLVGSDDVVVDVNEGGDKVEVHLDQDYKDKVLTKPAETLTDGVLVGISQTKVQENVYLGQGLEVDTVGGKKVLSANVNDDHTVVIDDNEITLKQFILDCENGEFDATDVGTIATIKKDNKTLYRIVLLDVDHDVLAIDGTTKAKTTWQFYDMPSYYCKLGLPFNVIDWGSSMGRAAANNYLNGTNTTELTWYPSNRGGYPTATGLIHSLHSIYEMLPTLLQDAIKLVRKAINIPRSTRTIAANGGTETDNTQATYVAETLFHLSATEAGSTSYGVEGTAYAYMSSNENRIRYYNGSPRYYWLGTPYPSYSDYWIYVDLDGSVDSRHTHHDSGVAPAFCI